MIKIQNLSKKYNDFYVLKNINLSLPSKGLIGISGESGSGKTTLLNAISLIDDEYEGEIIVNGKNILKYSKKENDKCFYQRKKTKTWRKFKRIPYLSKKKLTF